MTKEELREQLLKLNVSFEIEDLETLLNDTLETNKKFNLTAIKEPEKFRELMIYDSVLPTKLIDFDDKKVIDVGTGAGYPGLVLALTTDGDFTLLDSTKKKIDHINEYVEAHNISNVKGMVARAEEYAKNMQEIYDIAIARAVAPLNILLELIMPMVKVGGYFIAMKGLKGKEEIEESKRALKEMGGEVEIIDAITLPESNEVRMNILIKKVKSSNKKYPREYKQILSKPL